MLIILEKNQSLITSKGGARLLANTASRTDDPQTLRMVAGAIANLCGNGKLRIVMNWAICFEFPFFMITLVTGFFAYKGVNFIFT